jgi:hypothetical protein
MRRGLQVLLAVVGAVAVVAGIYAVLFGADRVVGTTDISANVDSEFRFYAAWYVIAGALLLGALRAVERERRIIRVVAAGFFLGACGRVLSIIATGTPSRLYIALMVTEFVLPAVIVPWQAVVASKAGTVPSDSG